MLLEGGLAACRVDLGRLQTTGLTPWIADPGVASACTGGGFWTTAVALPSYLGHIGLLSPLELSQLPGMEMEACLPGLPAVGEGGWVGSGARFGMEAVLSCRPLLPIFAADRGCPAGC